MAGYFTQGRGLAPRPLGSPRFAPAVNRNALALYVWGKILPLPSLFFSSFLKINLPRFCKLAGYSTQDGGLAPRPLGSPGSLRLLTGTSWLCTWVKVLFLPFFFSSSSAASTIAAVPCMAACSVKCSVNNLSFVRAGRDRRERIRTPLSCDNSCAKADSGKR